MKAIKRADGDGQAGSSRRSWDPMSTMPRSWMPKLEEVPGEETGRRDPSGPSVGGVAVQACLPLMNATVRGEDGLTAWRRARGRPFRQRLIGFVESCMYKLPTKGPQHDAEGNMGPRWKSAVFL